MVALGSASHGVYFPGLDSIPLLDFGLQNARRREQIDVWRQDVEVISRDTPNIQSPDRFFLSEANAPFPGMRAGFSLVFLSDVAVDGERVFSEGGPCCVRSLRYGSMGCGIRCLVCLFSPQTVRGISNGRKCSIVRGGLRNDQKRL